MVRNGTYGIESHVNCVDQDRVPQVLGGDQDCTEPHSVYITVRVGAWPGHDLLTAVENPGTDSIFLSRENFNWPKFMYNYCWSYISHVFMARWWGSHQVTIQTDHSMTTGAQMYELINHIDDHHTNSNQNMTFIWMTAFHNAAASFNFLVKV